MFKKLSFAAVAMAMSATALVPVAPAMAQRGYYQNDRYDRYDRDDRRYDDRRVYSDRRGYARNRYDRSRQRCDNGTGGTVIGAIAGGLLGNTVAGRGDRLLGTILGGGAGALAGRAIDRSDSPGYCRR
ncbi:hypothetical protein ASE75_10370 [Sphingomonas sp. Leaf17]|nr:glycine zipper 2TM domain-containing protein [Sphingomonas sp. Leaf17]KQM64369.1 hypothetical protein ASE75_10370 [Sphingomonas sp. Leaf17]